MGNRNLFSAFEVLSTSCYLLFGYIARYAFSLCTAFCSTIPSRLREWYL